MCCSLGGDATHLGAGISSVLKRRIASCAVQCIALPPFSDQVPVNVVFLGLGGIGWILEILIEWMSVFGNCGVMDSERANAADNLFYMRQRLEQRDPQSGLWASTVVAALSSGRSQ